MSKQTLGYRGYEGSIEASIEDGCLFGRILDIDDQIVYEGNTIPEIRKAFEEMVDFYLAHCEKTGAYADKPYKGTFNVRVGKEMHKKIAHAARRANVSMNEWICQVLADRLEQKNAADHRHRYVYVDRWFDESQPADFSLLLCDRFTSYIPFRERDSSEERTR